MIVLNVFKMILIFYLLLHSFKHLVAEDSVDVDLFADYPEPETESDIFYKIKTPETADAIIVTAQRKLSTLSRKPSASTRATTARMNDANGTNKTTKYSESRTSSISTKTAKADNTSTSSIPINYTMVLGDYISFTRGIKELPSIYDSGQKDYTNFSVLSISPGSIEQLNEILEFEYKNYNYNFWSHRRVLDVPLIVVLPPDDTNLRSILRQHKIDYTILIENLQNVFEYENGKSVKQLNPSLTGISFNMYLRYEFVMDYLTHLSLKYPEIARVIRIGKTIEDRNITLIEVKDPDPPEKTIGAVLIQAGMHGREWLGVSAALYLINQLVEHASANSDMFDGIFWYILPIFNADGYEYAHANDRLWKNNRRTYQNCSGVDLDRNFEVGANLEYKSLRKMNCTNLYGGSKHGSEPETQALKRFLKATKKILKVFISLHSGDPFIGYPWAYKSERSADYEQIVKLATSIKKAMEEQDNSTNFSVDRLYSLCGPYDGAAIDWAKQEGVIYPLMVSLKGGLIQGFDVPSERIFDTVVTAFDGIRAIANHLHIAEHTPMIVEQKNQVYVSNSSTIRFFALGIVIWLIISCVI